MGWPRLFKIMSFFFFYKGRSSRYTIFFRWNFNFVKNKASVAFLVVQNMLLKMTNFWGDLLKSSFLCILAMQNGYFFNTKKLDLSMYYMRDVTELSKSSNFSSSEYMYFSRRSEEEFTVIK
jgi:hypothetical protein